GQGTTLFQQNPTYQNTTHRTPSASQSNKEHHRKCSINERGGVGSARYRFAQRSEYSCTPPQARPPPPCWPPSCGCRPTGSTTRSSGSTSPSCWASASPPATR